MLQTLKLLLPAIVPSWRFFDRIAASPRIEFALLETPQETFSEIPAAWQEFRPRPARLSFSQMLRRLFWNPRWNEFLFLVSCAERLMAAPTEHSEREIITRLRAELARHPTLQKRYLQFRLAFISRKGDALEKQVAYTSPAYSFSGDVAS